MRPAVVTALLGLVLALTAAHVRRRAALRPGGRVRRCSPSARSRGSHLGSRGLADHAHRQRAARARGRPVRDRHPRPHAARWRCPPGLIEDPLLPAPAPIGAGRRTAHVVIDARFARRGRKRLVEPSVDRPRPVRAGDAGRPGRGRGRGARPAADREGRHARRARATAPAWPRGRGAAVGRRRGRPRRPAPAPRPGAPASRMYWPALARGGELVERRLRADTDTRPLVVLDPRGAAGDAPLDAAVRAAASLAVHLARPAAARCCCPGDRRPTVLEPTLAAWEHAHARLAVVDRRARPEPRGPRRTAAARSSTSPRARAAAAAAGADARAGRRADPRRPGHDAGPARDLHRRRLRGLRAVRPARRARRWRDGGARRPRRRPGRAAARGAGDGTAGEPRRRAARRLRAAGDVRRAAVGRAAHARRPQGRMLLGVVAAAGGGPACCSSRGRDSRRCVRVARRDRGATLGVFVLALLVAGVPRAAARARALGRARVRARAGDRVAAGDHGALPRASTSGCAIALIAQRRRCSPASPRSSPSGRARGARRRASRSPPRSRSARSTRSRSSSTARRRPYLGGAVFCILLAHVPLARAAARRTSSASRSACVLAVTVAGGLRRAAPRRSLAVARLRADRRGPPARAGGDVQLEPQLRPDDLAARRARGPARSRPRARRTGRPSTSTSSTGCAGSTRARSAPAVDTEIRAPRVDRDDPRRRPRRAQPPVRRRRPHAARPAGRAGGGAASSRARSRPIAQAARARVELPGAGLRAAPDRSPAAHGRARAIRSFASNYLAMRLPRAAVAHGRPRGALRRRTARSRQAGAGFRNGFQAGGRRARRSSASAYARMYALAQALKAQTEHAVRLRAGRAPARPERRDVQRDAAAGARAAHGLHVRQPARLLPAVLGRDGAAAADGRRARARGVRLQPRPLRPQARRVRRPRRRRPLVGRGVLPRHRLGRPSTRRRPPRPRARRSPTSARAPTPAPRSGRTSASARRATARSRRATRARGSPPARQRDWTLDRRCSAWSCALLVAGAVVARPPRARAGRAARARGRRAAARAAPQRAHAAARRRRSPRSSARSAAATPRSATCARVPRAALRRRRERPDARPSGARCGASSASGPRPRRAAARVVGPTARDRPPRALHWVRWTREPQRLRALPQRHATARGGRLPRRDRARSRARVTSSPTRARSARRSAARCSARAATRRRPRSSATIVERAPTNDYALFCLGRSLQLMGRHAEARRPLALAANLRPERADYRQYRDHSRRRAAA